jgi:hypothetical protein
MFLIAHFADRGAAIHVHLANFSGTKAQLSVTSFSGKQLN